MQCGSAPYGALTVLVALTALQVAVWRLIPDPLRARMEDVAEKAVFTGLMGALLVGFAAAHVLVSSWLQDACNDVLLMFFILGAVVVTCVPFLAFIFEYVRGPRPGTQG